MKLLLLFLPAWLVFAATYVQPEIKFTKVNSSFMRKPGVVTQAVGLTAKKVTTAQNVTIKRLSGPGSGVSLHTDPTVHSFSTPGESSWSVILDVSDDTTKKDTEYHTLELTYTYLDAANNSVTKTETHVVALTAFREDPPAPVLIRDDVLLFTGSNIDPANDGAALTSFSFETIFKLDLGKGFHMRLGGYSNRNFSTDSATALPQTRYITTTPGIPAEVGKTQLVVQRFVQDVRTTTRSAGLYADLFYTLAGKKSKDFRLSVTSHFEYVRRKIIPTVAFVNVGDTDTITYTQALADRRIVIQSSLTTSENAFVPRRNLDQYFITAGIAIEKATRLFDIFFQPLGGVVVNNLKYSHRPNQLFVSSYFTLGVRAQATIKLLDVTLAIDLKDINTSSPFTNVSIGIPVSGKKLTERVKELSGG
ncbi:hypothetical protein [Larkinella soli]|uniref:hypothetical protein n=1 Tax=Larkinella soli TaxID=1770527 RepID=UPI000FFB69E0|nr:hypothetical protein [Larkinella soli]